MHYYQHNIKDFNNATRHLTRVERCSYRDAIELYYDTESPLTGDFERLSRKLLCVTTEEKDALMYVLNEFFYLVDDEYRHTRCDFEIEKFHNVKTAKAAAGKASAESKRKKRESKKEQNQTEGKHVLNPVDTEHQQSSTNQQPITNNQQPITNIKGTSKYTYSEAFECFWRDSGIDNGVKKKASIAFERIVKEGSYIASGFAEILIEDCHWRRSNQFGFANIHATTYLNNERWKEKRVRTIDSQQPSQKQPVLNNNDTSWIDLEDFEEKYT